MHTLTMYVVYVAHQFCACRERKKAHLDVLQQKVSLLEKTNIALSEQLALREAEVLQLKSRLDDVTG